MELSRQDTHWVAGKLVSYFADFKRIDDYFRARKIERVKDLPAPLFGFGLEDDMFQNYDMHPQDMNFKITQIPNETFDAMLEKTASFSPESSIPGKALKLVVKETTTNTIVGFIRYGSPLINSKPRNDYLGQTPDLEIFNKHAIMGFNIVPIQPFGYNYLGGKLLAAICCSHETRRMLNAKYNTEFCLFETTSLYGNIKGASMYDGMRPFLRYRGDTQSNFLLTLGEELYFELRDWFTDRNDGEPIIHHGASSRKLKMQTKMIGLVKQNLKRHDQVGYEHFCKAMETANGVTTQKRFYMSEWGYSNTRDVILGKTDKLIKAENFDRFEMEGVLAWWKKHASKRFNNVIAQGRNRTQLEVWNKDTMNSIDIIR